MTFNPTPLTLRSHDQYLDDRNTKLIGGRTLEDPNYDPVTKMYMDYCLPSCPFCNGCYEDEKDALIELENDGPVTYEGTRDMRSSAREKKWPLRFRNKKPRTIGIRCRMAEKSEKRERNKRNKRKGLRFAVQEIEYVGTRHTPVYKPVVHQVYEWDLGEEQDDGESIGDDLCGACGHRARGFGSLEASMESDAGCEWCAYDGSDAEWDVVSSVSSDAWSVLDLDG